MTAETKALDPDMPAEEMRLHMGELSANEVLVARAAIRWANSFILDVLHDKCRIKPINANNINMLCK